MKYCRYPKDYNKLLRTYFPDEFDNEEERLDVERAEPLGYQETPRKTQFIESRGGRQVKKDPRIAKTRLKAACYQCEIDPNHKTFTSYITDKNYVEVHHLVPLQFQEEFGDNSLDHEANILSLCPNCHRRLHHAVIGEKEDLLKRLFSLRREQLKLAGIDLTLGKFLSYSK